MVDAKSILDRYATNILRTSAVYYDAKDGKDKVNSNPDNVQSYNKDNPACYSEDIVLWKAPNDWIRLEFDGVPSDKLKDYIGEVISNLKSQGIAFFITQHNNSTSPYINIPNIKKLRINGHAKQAKLLWLETLMPKHMLKSIDRTNLSWTWTPVIGHPHWKKHKHGGAVHQIVLGADDVFEDNEFPPELNAKITRQAKKHETTLKNLNASAKWVEDFLLDYCCNNALPEGNRHSVINKNLGILIAFREDVYEIIEKYERYNSGAGSVAGWVRGAVNGTFTEVNALELRKYIKENEIPYKIVESREAALTDNLQNTIEHFTDKRNLAQLFYKNQPFYYDKGRNYWLWNTEDLYWYNIDETDLLNAVNGCSRADTISSKEKSEICEAFKQYGRAHTPEPLPENTLQIGRNLVNVMTGDIVESTPEYFSTNRIPHNLGESEETPIIDKLFADWLGPDKQLFLQEVATYCMLPDYPIHRIFCLVGDGSNGKSTFIRFIHRLVGADNTCSVSMDGIMSNRFETWNMYRKLLAEMGETHYDSLRRTDMLKKLSGQDAISFERKRSDTISAINYAKLMISTNSVPETHDRTDGFYRRWLLIKFTRKFADGRDILNDIPPEEYENFCRKAIRIIHDLLKRGSFDKEPTLEEKKRIYEEQSDPLALYLKKETIEDHNTEILKYEFRDKFNMWCAQHKFREHSEREIGMRLKDKGFETKRIQIDDLDEHGNRKRYWAYSGLRWAVSPKASEDVGVETQQVSERAEKVFKTIQVMPTNNKDILYAAFGREYIDNLVRNGQLFEGKSGELRVL